MTLPFRGHEPFPDEPATFGTELFVYFTLAFGISWSGVLLAASRSDLYLLLAAMIAGPAGTALALTAMFDGTRGLGALARRLVRWRVGLRIFMTWIYTHTRSLLVGILLHAGFTGGQRLLWPSAPPEGELVWYGVFAGALWLVVAAVVVFARRAHFPPPPPPAR